MMVILMSKNKTVKSVMYGKARLISSEEEIDFVKDISKGKKYLDKPDDKLKSKERKLKKKAQYASSRLVEAYAPLIEKIAKEKYSDVQSSTYSYDDFISEAYIVAVQCAYKFDPFKGRKVIRFSSYVSRPVASALQRLNYKTKTLLYVPNDKIAKARKWSHPYFALQNMGVDVSDEMVSKISGVDMKQHEVASILDSTALQSIDDIIPPSVYDDNDILEDEDYKEKITHAFTETFPEDHLAILQAIGLLDEKAVFSSFLLSNNENDIDREYAQEILDRLPTIMSHPIYRFRLQSHIL